MQQKTAKFCITNSVLWAQTIQITSQAESETWDFITFRAKMNLQTFVINEQILNTICDCHESQLVSSLSQMFWLKPYNLAVGKWQQSDLA